MPVFPRLLTYLRPYRGQVALGFVFLLLAVALELAPPLVWKSIIDAVIFRHRWAALWPVLLGLTAIQGGSAGGELMGVPATGRAIDIAVLDLFQFQGGRLIEHWALLDNLGLLRQIGVLAS